VRPPGIGIEPALQILGDRTPTLKIETPTVSGKPVCCTIGLVSSTHMTDSTEIGRAPQHDFADSRDYTVPSGESDYSETNVRRNGAYLQFLPNVPMQHDMNMSPTVITD